MATFGKWLTVNPTSGGGGTTTVTISGTVHNGRGIREQELWFNPTNSTDVESVKFRVRQLQDKIKLSDFKEGNALIGLKNKGATKDLDLPSATALSYSFKTNAKQLCICAWNANSAGGTIQLTNIKVNNVAVDSPTTGVFFYEPTGDPGFKGLYEVSLTLNIGANTSTIDRYIRFFIAGSDEGTDPVKWKAPYTNYSTTDDEYLANVNITQPYTTPSVTITGTGVIKGDDGVYTTNSIPVNGEAQTFIITASDNLTWTIDDEEKTPTIDEGGFDGGSPEDNTNM